MKRRYRIIRENRLTTNFNIPEEEIEELVSDYLSNFDDEDLEYEYRNDSIESEEEHATDAIINYISGRFEYSNLLRNKLGLRRGEEPSLWQLKKTLPTFFKKVRREIGSQLEQMVDEYVGTGYEPDLDPDDDW